MFKALIVAELNSWEFSNGSIVRDADELLLEHRKFPLSKLNNLQKMETKVETIYFNSDT